MSYSPFKENIRQFYSLVEFESVSYAAHHLGVAQPQMTKVLQTLEGDVGFVLFERSNRGLKITPKGREFYEQLRKLEQHWAWSGEESVLGRFRIGAHPLVARQYVPAMVSVLKEKFPQLTVSYLEKSSKEVAHLVVAGELELGIAAEPVLLSGLVPKKVRTDFVGLWSAGDTDILVVNPQIVQYARYVEKLKIKNVVEVENYDVAARTAVELRGQCLLPGPAAEGFKLRLRRKLEDVSIYFLYSERNRSNPAVKACWSVVG